ncbi:MAG: hypothetical protein A2Y82_04965 [Candidatus Buchananbacteria bacterium RBG_13_36_9]|uniref:Fibronectin type-III domain-containing protein n=1 Tax=Candidatus Buchananbacteria bacterium RBG_13_36_9 TaxID=1797530 RepID=A0A1G1XQQ7_9BACT|nr:MAG: hypothetical protein A2Y82_04965 [Candidatus Buchananbacteria bacterium RBG_13_36_9]
MSKQGKNYKIWIIFCIFLITICFLLPQSLYAASLNTLSDKMSRGAPSTASDHLIKFTTPTGVGEIGQYIRISFNSGFNLAAINYTDLDLFHGVITGLETEETLSSAANATDWGVSVSGSQIDLTHPTNAANGDILPADKVVIKIGLNANGGDQQIINPGTIGSKVIAISGNFGDSGRLAVAIYQDQVGVGGQTFGAPPNAVILNNPANISQNFMDLSWSKNIDFDFDRYEVYRSTSPGVTNLTGILICSWTNNSQTSCTVGSLNQNTDYYFVVYVYDTEALFTPSNEVTAKTLTSGGPAIPPVPGMPTLDQRLCPIFLSATLLSGTKPLGTAIFINGLSDNVNYPTLTTWESLVDVIIGNNLFLIWARDNYGQNSSILNATIIRCEVGDTNCNNLVDDFDLSGLAYHWDTDWCYADFNEDKIVNDFDLSGLASHWDSVY